MKFPEQSINALIKFGYTERESQFLYLVATFSGNFVRRHFTDFIGAAGPGWPEAEFLKKVIQRKHVHEIPYRRSTFRRFHLAARSVYEAIDKGNSSNRKPASDFRAVLKMKMLSFVLDNFNEDYLEEEADKVAFFTEQQGISRQLLPRKNYESQRRTEHTVRYFVDKFPLFISADSRPQPIAVFTYFEEEVERLTGFPAHLNWYKPLLFSLQGQYKFIYVADTPKNFHRAEKQFEAVLANPHQAPSPALLNYFRLKRLWDERKLSQLTDSDLAALNQAEKKFSQPEHEQLYRQWVTRDQPAAHPEAERSIAPRLGTFETYLLNI